MSVRLRYDESRKQSSSSRRLEIYSVMRKGFSQPDLLLENVYIHLAEYKGLERSFSFAKHESLWLCIFRSTHFLTRLQMEISNKIRLQGVCLRIEHLVVARIDIGG